MISFSKKKHLSRIRIFIIVLASAGLFCLALPVIAQESVAPLNPDFLEYFQRLQSFGVQRMTVDGYPLGFIPPPLDLSHLMGQPIFQAHELAAAPSSYDLRTLGKVTPVRDQGNCGSCWTFATYGSLESNLLPSETWDFSENNLKNTHGFDSDPCEGGHGYMSTAYLARWSGPVSEADDPYNPSSNISPSGLTVRKHIQEVLIIPGRANSSDNDNIKQAVMTYGALMTSMYYDGDPAYSYYNPTYNAYYYNGTANTNHVVAIVGWDDNFDKNKFSIVPLGNGAFIIKNSWGTGWGENGYFYISYYDTLIGKYNYMFNGAEPTTDYSRIYHYDPLGWVTGIGYGSTTAWFANIFIASATELLSTVSFYTASPNSSYEIYIYTNVTSGPTSGSLSGNRTGTIAYAGYHTIPLDIPVSLASGQKFSVAVKLTTPGYNYPISIEKPIPSYSSQATAQAGESYISPDGMNWKDITVSYPNTNVCVKAFTIQGPNLTPYQPSGWSDKIVVSKTTGTNTDSTPLYTTDTLYVDFAILNDSDVSISSRFYTALYVDGVLKNSWYCNSLNAHSYVYVNDYSIGSLSAGTHTIKIVADSTGAISESSETDNEYSKTIAVTAIIQPNLTPYKPTGWSDKIVVSTTTGTNIDSTPIYPTDTLYVDWAVINNGTGATSATFYTTLYVDGVARQSWYKDPPLNINYYIAVSDYSIGTLSAGNHTIKIVTDTTGAISESSETDNEYTKTIAVSGAEFTDVPPAYWAYNYIMAIYNNHITVGCSQNPLKYCPEDNVTRGQMAAFIIRSKYGETFSYTTTPYFTDVPSTHTFFKYVQKLRDDGITVVIGTYWVDDYVTRGQMAAFIIRAKFGENFTYTTTPYFSDVPSTHNFFKYVQKMKDEGITAVTGTYNVDNIVTRAQMAAFLARAFLGME